MAVSDSQACTVATAVLDMLCVSSVHVWNMSNASRPVFIPWKKQGSRARTSCETPGSPSPRADLMTCCEWRPRGPGGRALTAAKSLIACLSPFSSPKRSPGARSARSLSAGSTNMSMKYFIAGSFGRRTHCAD
jgi:hypothetical protein